MAREVGDRCEYNHGNAAPPCTWDGERWQREDGQIIPNPFDQSNLHRAPGTN